jgi:hypothetical protein
MTFSFSNLSLAGVTAAASISVLAPGKYVVKVKDAEVTDTKAKTGKILKLKLVCDQGVITDNINVFNANKQAEEIGLGQLKAMLECAGHPNPNAPGGVDSIKGLTVGIVVGQDGVYDGQPRYKVKSYLRAADIGSSTPAAATSLPAIGDDDIPF